MSTLRRDVVVGFGLCLIILAAVAFSSYRSIGNLLVTTAEEAAVRDFVLQLRDVLQRVDEAETGQRGYVITGNDRFLQPYLATLSQIDKDVAEVRAALPPGVGLQAQVDQLDSLVRQKLAFVQSTVDLRRNAGLAAASERIATGQGQELMDRIREVANRIEHSLTGRLAGRQQRVLMAATRTRHVITTASVLAIAVVLAATGFTFREITRREQAEHGIETRADELRSAYIELDSTRREQLQIKDQFLSNVSHELRTPLNASYQFLTLVLDGVAGELNAEQRDYLEVALRNTNSLKSMISDLLDITRIENARLVIEPVELDLAELVRDTVRVFRASAAGKFEIEVAAESDLPKVAADPVRVRQVIINLVENAMKFTTPPATIMIEVQQPEDDPHVVRVSIIDTGIGIPADDIPRLFDRLYQVRGTAELNRRGLGIGLYISRELVVRQAGTIWVESEPGVGSTFHFTLPVAMEPPLLESAMFDERTAMFDERTAMLDERTEKR